MTTLLRFSFLRAYVITKLCRYAIPAGAAALLSLMEGMLSASAAIDMRLLAGFLPH